MSDSIKNNGFNNAFNAQVQQQQQLMNAGNAIAEQQDALITLLKFVKAADNPGSVTASGNVINNGPALQTPETINLNTVSVESLMDVLNNMDRDTTVKTSTASLKANSDARKANLAEAQKKLEEIIQKQKEEENKSFFQKLFGWIGKALCLVGSAITIAVGAATGQVWICALGALALLSTIDNIVMEETGSGAMSSLIKAVFKCDDETAKKAAFWVNTGIGLVCGVASGVGAAGQLAKAIDAGTKVAIVVKQVNLALQISGSLNSIGSGVVGIFVGMDQRDIMNLKSDQQILKAAMMSLQLAYDRDQQHLKEVLDKANKVNESVKEIIEDIQETNTAVATGGGAQMA